MQMIAALCWWIGDGDMHLKNLALLKIVGPAVDRFSTIRLAPLYNAVTKRVFASLGQECMALMLNGKNDRLAW